MTAFEIAKYITSFRFRYDTEDELQERIFTVLCDVGLVVKREVRINENGRLDFLIDETEDAGPVAVEVKIRDSRPSVLTQLHRYAQSDRVSAIVLVTVKARHRNMPAEINGKPIHVANLMGCAFA